ncbi:MAG: BatA domain-containing protein [Planctomycetota bacterium]
MSFLNPGLLWGLALISVPILIHFLNRQRFKRVPWAATRFLLAAFQKTNRRSRLENLLLLLVRCAIIALLALALSRPLITPEGSLAQVLPGDRPEVIVVLDNSFSLDYRGGGGRAYDRATAAARQVIDEKRQDRTRKFSLVLVAEPVEIAVWDGSADDVLERLRVEANPWSTPGSPGRALDLINDRLSQDETAREIYWVTDLQRNGWIDAEEVDANRALASDTESPEDDDIVRSQFGLDDLFRAVAERCPTPTVVDVSGSSRHPANLAIVDLGTEDPSIAVNNTATFTATVKNFGLQDRTSVTATLFVDGNKRPVKTLDVPAGGESTVAFRAVFEEPGFHNVMVELESDGLQNDNQRSFAFEVREGIRVLIVSGDERIDDPFESEAYFLSGALDPSPSDDPERVEATFRPKVIDDTVFDYGQETLSEYDVIVLANVPSIGEPKVIESLEDFVRSGGSLWITLGDQVMASRYNSTLWMGGLGKGLMPVELTEMAPERGNANYYKFADVDYEHPTLQLFEHDRFRDMFSDARVLKFFRAKLTEADEKVRVIARFDDEEQSPAIIERPLDYGRVFLLTTSIDDDWNQLVSDPMAFLPFVHDVTYYLSAHDRHVFNLPVGSPLKMRLRDIYRYNNVQLKLTGTTQYSPDWLRKESEMLVVEPFQDLRQPGVVEVTLIGNDSSPKETLQFALGLNPDESDLRRFEPRDFESIFEGVRVLTADGLAAEITSNESRGGGEIWKYLLAAAALLLGVESIVAWRIGKHGRS